MPVYEPPEILPFPRDFPEEKTLQMGIPEQFSKIPKVGRCSSILILGQH